MPDGDHFVVVHEEISVAWFDCDLNLVSEVQCFDKPFYITGKDIRPGEELFVYYGNSYAAELGIDVANYKSET